MGNRYFGTESEDTYGTVPAAGENSQFMPIESETVLDGALNEFILPETIQFMTPSSLHMALGKYKHQGGISGFVDLHNSNWMLCLKALMGDPATATPGGVNPRTHTFTPYVISDTIESLGLRLGPVVLQDGAEKELTCNGTGAKSMAWEYAAGEKIGVTTDFLIKSADLASVSTPVYADTTTAYGSAATRAMTGNEVRVFRDTDGDNSFADESAEAKVISGSHYITNNFDEDAFFCNSRELGGLYLESIEMGGELTMLWDSWDEWELFWGAENLTAPHATTFDTSKTALKIEFGGETASSDAEIEAGYYYGLDFTFPQVIYKTISSGITSTNKPVQTIVWQALYDESTDYGFSGAVEVVAWNDLTDCP